MSFFDFVFDRSINGYQILSDLQRQPEVQKLLSKAGLVKINVRDHIAGGFEAEYKILCDCSSFCGRFQHINVKKMHRVYQRGAALFELTNIVQRVKFAQVHFNLRNNEYNNAEDYVRAMEKIEFEGIVAVVGIEKEINSRLQEIWIDTKFSNIPKAIIGNRDFENYYKNHLADEHKAFYRRSWHKKMGIPLNESGHRKMYLMVICAVVIILSNFLYKAQK